MTRQFSIQIELAPKNTRSLGACKPKGSVEFGTSDNKDRRSIPASAARALKKLQDEGELEGLDFSSFKEKLNDVLAQCAWKRILSLIEKRDYSVNEAQDKLKLDGFPPAISNAAIERACSNHLIDDVRFSEFFVRAKVNAGWGMERIKRELYRKGIEAKDVPGWPEEYFSDDADFERAHAIASRKRLSGKNDYEKIIRLLSSKGYPLSICRRVASAVLDSADD